ncbi:hypothetical protein FHG87_025437, partial [Trinorchestia longiramus]
MDFTSEKFSNRQMNIKLSSRTKSMAPTCSTHLLNTHTTSPTEYSCTYTRVSNNTLPASSPQRHTSSVKCPSLCLWLLIALASSLVSLAHCEDLILWKRPAPVGATPTPSPEQNFREQPANASVVEGDIAIMKCKANKPVHHCRWYYTEMERSFYDEGSEPKLVLQFDPSTDNDCSIRFTK